MDTKISLIGLAIIIMLAIGIACGTVYYDCKVLSIGTIPPSGIMYTLESNDFGSGQFIINFDGSQNANYQQEMANLLRDAFFTNQNVSIVVGDETTTITAVGTTGPVSPTPSYELRRTEVTNELTSKIYTPNNGAKLSSKTVTPSTVAELLNNTNSIGVSNLIKRGPALNP